MKNKYLAAAAVAVVMFLAALAAVVIHGAGSTQSPADGRAKLVGTWRLASGKYGGRESPLPEKSTTFKHVTPTHFTWMIYEGETGRITRAGGGTYTLQGDKYTESAQYGIGGDIDTMKGKDHTFSCRVEAGKWYSTGALANGMEISEVWELVK